MREQGMTTARLGAFSDGVIAVIITIMVLELKAPDGADIRGAAASLADGRQLCRELPVHRDHLGEPPPSAAFRAHCLACA